jgi:hypothetical protein
MAGTVVIKTGPIFDGRAQAALDAYVREMPKKIAEEGASMVRDRLNTVLRRNRGVYVNRVHVRSGIGGQVIDNNMVYSPWLEGVSQRNHSTRFKGYHTFRLIGQELDRKAEPMAEEILRPYLNEMQ